jgi:putative addiction module killer protein
MKIVRKKQLEVYVTSDGKKPFVEWLESLKDGISRYRIKERLDRIALGNMGDFKSISGGIYELRLAFGSGYRIYYGQEGKKIILLLCGGDKSTQKEDIKKAIGYWQDYCRGEK